MSEIITESGTEMISAPCRSIDGAAHRGGSGAAGRLQAIVSSTGKMSAVEFLINFVNARLSAAVDEIFTVFENTIVKYEQDIARQRRLLESFWKPEIRLRRIDHPQLHVSAAEKVLPTKQLGNQERNFSLDQEEPGPPQEEHEDLLTSQEEPELPRIKGQQKLFSSQEGEQLALKLETFSFMGTPVYEECREHEPNRDQLLSHSSPNRSLEGHKHVDSGSAATERKPRKKRRRNESAGNCEENCHPSKSRHRAGKKSVKCDVGKTSFMKRLK